MEGANRVVVDSPDQDHGIADPLALDVGKRVVEKLVVWTACPDKHERMRKLIRAFDPDKCLHQSVDVLSAVESAKIHEVW
jgi:hypothetical protein